MSYVRKGCFKCGNVPALSPSVFATTASNPDTSQIFAPSLVPLIRSSATLAAELDISKPIAPRFELLAGHIARNCRNQARFNSGNGDHSGASIMSDTNGTTEGGSPNGGSLDSAVIRAPDAVSYPPHPTFPSGRGGGRGGYMGRMHPGGGRHFNNHMNGAGSGPGARITCY
ncbi:hypothetical protein BGW38_005944, partial [Lunasporangiospora selenospora]